MPVMRCQARPRRGHYLCGWFTFALEVYISGCGWERCVEEDVNKSADVCVIDFVVDGEGAKIYTIE